MKPKDSPFPPHWWGIGLDMVGLEAVRPRIATYGQYDYALLPPPPFDLTNKFEWLNNAPKYETHIGYAETVKNTQAWQQLKSEAGKLKLALPEAFIRFLDDPSLHESIRSNTDCFLDICPAPVPSPMGGGYLIRFLADSQGCIFWYLYLNTDATDHAVVSSSSFYGTKAEQWGEEPNPSDIVFCGESFELFLWRFWIENELWFTDYDGSPLPDGGRHYIEQYLARANAK